MMHTENFTTGTGRNKLTRLLTKMIRDAGLAANANVLRIGSAADLRAFGEEFGRPVDWSPDTIGIDWRAVASRWQGIIIAPYIGECRFDRPNRWYYVWDVASGCIWNPAAIDSVRVIGRYEPVAVACSA